MIGDFAETAAFCSVLDAVICVDTSIAHLAGAIHRPVHLLLAYVADARWHHLRSDSPWYPSLSIHRQEKTNSGKHLWWLLKIHYRNLYKPKVRFFAPQNMIDLGMTS